MYVLDESEWRVESVEVSTATFYGYVGTETLYEKAGSVSTDFVYANGLRIARVAENSVSYYHADDLDSTRLAGSSSGTITFSNGYQPFGQDNGTPMGSEGYKFTGKQSSTSNGFYYHFQRWYDTSTGRFISEDPVAGGLSDPQSQHQYNYDYNTPT